MSITESPSAYPGGDRAPKRPAGALNWAVAEMTDRYKKFAECNVRDLKGYNERVEKIKDIEDDKSR